MIADVARTDVLTAAPETPAADLAAAMRRRDTTLVAVLDEGRPVGVVTAARIGLAVGEDPDATAVGDRPAAALVPAEPPTIPADADTRALVATLADEGLVPVTVVDGDEGFVGVVTAEDALAASERDLSALLELLG
jgi:CBS domain-containing protein